MNPVMGQQCCMLAVQSDILWWSKANDVSHKKEQMYLAMKMFHATDICVNFLQT